MIPVRDDGRDCPRGFSRPSGTGWRSECGFPALKRRAIFERPYGTRGCLFLAYPALRAGLSRFAASRLESDSRRSILEVGAFTSGAKARGFPGLNGTSKLVPFPFEMIRALPVRDDSRL
jgi:hypothetical protein